MGEGKDMPLQSMDGGRRVGKIFFLKNKHFWSNACMKKKNYEIIVKLTRY